MSSNATELFSEMYSAIVHSPVERHSSDGITPRPDCTYEAYPPCQSFSLTNIFHNLVTQRQVDQRWAIANVLHFFTGTDRAGSLYKYNRYAEKFLTGDRWIGAYGNLALGQLIEASYLLQRSPSTRRAYVCMGNTTYHDMNQPPCWNTLHFLMVGRVLELCVYQRSLYLHGVMPYDCILLCNILNWMSHATGTTPGALRWCVGSLHMRQSDVQLEKGEDVTSGILVPAEVLDCPNRCEATLNGHGDYLPEHFRRILYANPG